MAQAGRFRSGGQPQVAQAAGIAIAPILFAIAILAVLATAIASSSGSFSQNTDTEKARTQASGLLQLAASMRTAVARVMALGCRDDQLNFNAPPHYPYNNPTAPADKHCNIYDPVGGGMIYVPPSDDLWSGVGSQPMHAASGANVVPGIGTGEPELAMVAAYIRKDVCDQINSLLGLSTSGVSSAIFSTIFTGTYASTYTLTATYTGRSAACVYSSLGGGSYFFYSVLLAR